MLANNEDSESELPKDNEVGGSEDDESDSDELPCYQVPANSQAVGSQLPKDNKLGGPEDDESDSDELPSYQVPVNSRNNGL